MVPAGRDRVAAFLLDVERVSVCVPGVDEVVALGEGRYQATLRVQMGPIRSQFAGEVTVDDTEAPARLTAIGQGRDKATGSQAKVEFAASLSSTDGAETTVACVADVTIRGRLGQFGTGVITSTAKSLVREFADCAARTLQESPGAEGAVGSEPVGPPAAASLARVVRRGLWLYLQDLLRRLRSVLRWRRDGRDGRGPS